MIETDHDIRNPAGLTAIERITAAIMAIGGVRMVQSASHPNGMVSKQAALTASAGNLGDQLDEFSDQLTSRQATFTNLEAAVRDVVSASIWFRLAYDRMAMDLARSVGPSG
ncbi:hypothetical protein [Mycobacterium tuberculosis]|uniref:hypothetical protein n=1 Tax=Mycobacterium tuberculosis TaxID=1773 RepID=UPI001F41851B|nr:hypothetical protein [Mycobacterium tuberculosis]